MKPYQDWLLVEVGKKTLVKRGFLGSAALTPEEREIHEVGLEPFKSYAERELNKSEQEVEDLISSGKDYKFMRSGTVKTIEGGITIEGEERKIASTHFHTVKIDGEEEKLVMEVKPRSDAEIKERDVLAIRPTEEENPLEAGISALEEVLERREREPRRFLY